MVQGLVRRYCQIRDTVGGQDLSSGGTKVLFDTTDKNDDATTYTVDLGNEEIDLLRVGWYMVWGSMHILLSNTANAAFAPSFQITKNAVAIPGTVSTRTFGYQPLGFFTIGCSLSPVLFENTVAGHSIAMVTTVPEGNAFGTKTSIAGLSKLCVAYLGA